MSYKLAAFVIVVDVIACASSFRFREYDEDHNRWRMLVDYVKPNNEGTSDFTVVDAICDRAAFSVPLTIDFNVKAANCTNGKKSIYSIQDGSIFYPLAFVQEKSFENRKMIVQFYGTFPENEIPRGTVLLALGNNYIHCSEDEIHIDGSCYTLVNVTNTSEAQIVPIVLPLTDESIHMQVVNHFAKEKWHIDPYTTFIREECKYKLIENFHSDSYSPSKTSSLEKLIYIENSNSDSDRSVKSLSETPNHIETPHSDSDSPSTASPSKALTLTKLE